MKNHRIFSFLTALGFAAFGALSCQRNATEPSEAVRVDVDRAAPVDGRDAAADDDDPGPVITGPAVVPNAATGTNVPPPAIPQAPSAAAPLPPSTTMPPPPANSVDRINQPSTPGSVDTINQPGSQPPQDRQLGRTTE